MEEIRINIQETNQNRSPTRHIGDYAVFELLGKGAFGSVYKVCKRTAGQTFLAMKEVSSSQISSQSIKKCNVPIIRR